MIALAPLLIWGWYLEVIHSPPSYVFYDENSRLVFQLSSRRGGVDDVAFGGGTLALAWWEIVKGRRYCRVSLIGRDMREFKRMDLGECGEARIGVDVDGLRVAVLYSKPLLSGEGCVVEVYDDGRLIYRKHLGTCDGGDVFLKSGGMDYVLVKGGRIEASWGVERRCEKVVYRGEWVVCNGERLSPPCSSCSF